MNFSTIYKCEKYEFRISMYTVLIILVKSRYPSSSYI